LIEQFEITLPPFKRGAHLITDIIENPYLRGVKKGIRGIYF